MPTFVHVRVVIGLALAMLLAAGPSLAARAASAPRWRVVYEHHFGPAAAGSTFLALAVVGNQEIWAVGDEFMNKTGSNTPVAARWNRGRWAINSLPSRLSSPLFGISADSSTDAWAVGTSFLLHWHMGHWAVARRWPQAESLQESLSCVAAFSPTNVWVFSSSGTSGSLGTWHLHGRTWTEVRGIGGDIAAVSALTSSNMWAIGGINVAEDSIVHYLDGVWHHVTAPALRGLQLRTILAISPDNIWATGGPYQVSLGMRLLHRHNRRWTSTKVPWNITFRTMASDRRGGLWLAGVDNISLRTWLVHYSRSGRWSRMSIAVGGLARIPGTTTLLGAGSVGSKHGLEAALWATSRLG